MTIKVADDWEYGKDSYNEVHDIVKILFLS